jgi:hypothetical protein
MSEFIKNILPRLKKFKDNVELTEALVDKVWTILGDKELIEYEFLRNGEIVVTKNGQGFDGSWRILGSGRLQIRTDFANNILLYDFSVRGILIMKLSGNMNEPFLLFDPRIVQSGNIEDYLTRISNGGVVTNGNSIQDERFYRLFSSEENQE